MRFSPWLTRALLAVLLAFGSEIMLWTNPAGRTLLDWLILAAGYSVLSAVLLDLAVRYRIRDLFGLMALAGIYGLAVGLLLNPQTALVDVPRTLITRVMGAHTLIGLAMLALFLKAGNLRRMGLFVVAIAGLAWGVWVRWLPTLIDSFVTETSLVMMVAYGIVGLILIVALLLAHQRMPIGEPHNLQLLPLERGLVAIILGAILILRLNAGSIDSLSLVIIVVLIAFCILMLWFQKREKGAILLDQWTIERVPILAVLLFLGVGVVGYSLPFHLDGEQLALIIGLFTAFGLVWLPTVSLVMGVRAYRKLTRTGWL
jgi:hypothetical protein